jgi:hypothetical protein
MRELPSAPAREHLIKAQHQKQGGEMTKKKDIKKVELPKPAPKKFIVAFLPGRD